MQDSQVPFQDAMARAREIAQRLAANAPNSHQNNSLKRSNNDEDGANKRPAFDLSNSNNNSDLSPALRAQLIAQKINSQLGVSSSLSSTNSSLIEEDYRIPDKFVGLVIGKKGEQIARIQEESGCKVKISNIRPDPVPGGPNPPDRIANLAGSREAIEQAKRIIDDIVSRGKTVDGTSASSNPYAMGGSITKSIDVMLPSAKCGLIIGKGGETIRRISEELGVKMFVVQEIINIDGIEHKPLKITGDSERLERAKQHVLGILDRSAPPANRATSSSTSNDYGSRTSGASMNGPCNEATYHVPYDKAGVIIGKGGESVKEISRRSGALVELDKTHVPAVANSGERLFKIRGTPDQIALAQQLMYEKVLNSPGGTGDLLPPLQFQQKFNLPLIGASSNDTWPNTTDPYGTNANSSSTDPYSQWANAYGQWPQMNSYDDGTGKSNNHSSTSSSINNPAGANNSMDPAWLAYYQSMNFYNNMMQSSTTGNATSTANSLSNTTDSTTTTNANTSTNSTSASSSGTGQADYTQQWIEYYRSLGQNDLADQIAQQTKENGGANGSKTTATGTTPTVSANATMMSSQDAWAAYAQQWATNNMASNSTNGHNSSTKH